MTNLVDSAIMLFVGVLAYGISDRATRTVVDPIKRMSRRGLLKRSGMVLICISVIMGFGAILNPKDELDRELDRFVLEANRNAPRMMNASTRLDKAYRAEGRRVYIVFTLVHVKAQDVDIAEWAKSMKPQAVRNAKANPGMAKLMSIGVRVGYEFYDSEGVVLSKFVIE
jgi:hypothetical protein